jgi:gamma-glutamyltranspeptidase/glutathione hydrolase
MNPPPIDPRLALRQTGPGINAGATGPGEKRAMFTTRPEIAGTFGAVASTHWIASGVGMAVLERGGNAFDAAAAAGFTLQIVEPHLNGPGGDCPIILHSERLGAQQVICGQGPAPRGPDGGEAQGGAGARPGARHRPAPAPGARRLRRLGADAARPRHLGAAGRARLRHRLRRAGAHMVPRVAATVETVRPLFETLGHLGRAVAAERRAEAGRTLRQPGAGRHLRAGGAGGRGGGRSRERRIDAARDAWYGGFVAEAIDRFCRTTEALDTSGRRHAGVLTGEDMARWRAGVEAPLARSYRGRHTVLKCGPWSQGPAMLQTLALAGGLRPRRHGPGGPEFVHTVAEAMKLAFADREAFYGDPDFVDVPIETCSRPPTRSTAGADRRAGRPGVPARQPGRRAPRTDYAAAVRRAEEVAMAAGTGEPTVSRLGASGGDTCHVDVIDRWGNMVSATPSAGWLQSSPAIPELGFCLGSRCQMFWLTRSCRTASSRASGRGRPFRPPWCCGTTAGPG